MNDASARSGATQGRAFPESAGGLLCIFLVARLHEVACARKRNPWFRVRPSDVHCARGMSPKRVSRISGVCDGGFFFSQSSTAGTHINGKRNFVASTLLSRTAGWPPLRFQGWVLPSLCSAHSIPLWQILIFAITSAPQASPSANPSCTYPQCTSIFRPPASSRFPPTCRDRARPARRLDP